MTVNDESDQLYVYGIITAEADVPENLLGIDEAPVEVRSHGDLAAVVTAISSEDELGTPDNLLAHSTVLDTIAADTPVLPMTFGTIVPTAEELHDTVLDEHESNYLETLQRLEGTAQYTVRARYIRDEVLADLVEEDPEVARLREAIAGTTEDETRQERIELGELIVNAFDRLRVVDAQQIVDAVSPTVEDLVEQEGGQVEDVVALAVLVHRDSAADFEDALETVAEQLHEKIHFQLLGPQAPYDFVGEQ